MYVCIINQKGKSLFHKSLQNSKETLKDLLEPYGSEIAVGVESTYNWYWVADTCEEENIPFFLGHALYMRSIHVDKFKDDELGIGIKEAVFQNVPSELEEYSASAIYSPSCKAP